MNLQLKAVRVNRCTFENKMGPNSKVNLKVDTRTQIQIPNDFKKGSIGSVNVRMTVGTPLDAIYIFLEQVATFIDEDATEKATADKDTMMSLFKTICVPMAMEEVEKTIKQICAAYRIPEIKLTKKSSSESNNYLN